MIAYDVWGNKHKVSKIQIDEFRNTVEFIWDEYTPDDIVMSPNVYKQLLKDKKFK